MAHKVRNITGSVIQELRNSRGSERQEFRDSRIYVTVDVRDATGLSYILTQRCQVECFI